MPSKESYLVAFLVTSAILGGLQYFVYTGLRRYLRQHFPHKARKWIPWFRWLFIFMNLPIAFIFFRRQIAPDIVEVGNLILYPFTVWVFLMLMWSLILAGVALVRVVRSLYRA